VGEHIGASRPDDAEMKAAPRARTDSAAVQRETSAALDPGSTTAPAIGRPQPKRPKRSPTFTSSPDVPAPHLLCPGCDRFLLYRETVISGVKPIERWDYFECRTCGTFVYRDRTRKLRPAD